MVELSVILPLYNGESYLNDTILSIEDNNKDLNVEILIVDDGSTDGSLKLARTLSKKHSNIVVLSKQNGGIASAREYGLQHCKGKYVTFCDQDDKLVLGYSSFLKRMKEYHADILTSNRLISRSGKIITEKIILEQRLYEHTDCVDMAKMYFCREVFTPIDVKERNLIIVLPTIWNCIFNVDFIRNKGLHFIPSVKHEDDWLFVGQSLGWCQRLLVVPESYYCWTINPKSESHRKRYIPLYFQKRADHKIILLNTVASLGGTPTELKGYEHIIDAITVILGGKNAFSLPYREYLQEIKQLSAFAPISQFLDFRIGKSSSLYLWLWDHHLNTIAYLLCKVLDFIRKFRK